MKKIFIASLLGLSLFSVQVMAAFTSTPTSLKSAVNTIEQFEESKAFLDECLSYGPIDLKFTAMGVNNSKACWVGHERRIMINSSKSWSEGQKISSILFELNNSLTHEKFVALNKQAVFGEISKSFYVETIERLEYENVLNTRKLLENGVNAGFFPKDALFPIAPNFKEHFRVQLATGHSDAIAAQYDHFRTQSPLYTKG